jgi:hypothetical protein
VTVCYFSLLGFVGVIGHLCPERFLAFAPAEWDPAHGSSIMIPPAADFVPSEIDGFSARCLVFVDWLDALCFHDKKAHRSVHPATTTTTTRQSTA